MRYSKFFFQFLLLIFMAHITYCGFFVNSVIQYTGQPVKFIGQNQKDLRVLINATYNQIFVLRLNYSHTQFMLNLYNKVIVDIYETPVFTQNIYRTLFLQSTNLGYVQHYFGEDLATTKSIIFDPPSTEFWLAMSTIQNQYFYAYNDLIQQSCTVERKLISVNSTIWSINNGSMKIYGIFVHDFQLYVTLYNVLAPTDVIIQVYDILPDSNYFAYEFHFPVTDINAMKIAFSPEYMFLYDGNTFKFYQTSALSLPIYISQLSGGNILYSAKIFDMKFYSSWFFISQTFGCIRQYDVLSGIQIAQLKVLFSNPRISINEESPNIYIIIWQKDGSIVYRMSIDNTNSSYTFLTNKITARAQFDTGLGLAFEIIPCQTCLKPQNISRNYSLAGFCLEYDSKNICSKFCPRQCQFCDQNQSCNKCRIGTSNDVGQGICKTEQNIIVPMYIIIFINLLPIRDIGKLYLVLNSLSFHQYHKFNYTSTIKDAIQLMNVIQQKIWQTINVQNVLDFISRPLSIPRYTGFTNEKFLQVERKDSFFLQNTQDFFCLALPASLLLFIFSHLVCRKAENVKKKLYYFLENFQHLYLFIFVNCIQNISKLVFLSCHHLHNLFSFNFLTKGLQCLSILIIGLIATLSVSFFSVYQHLYGRKSRNFYESFNIKKKKSREIFLMLIAVIKPMIEIVLNVFLYNNYRLMIALTSFVQFLAFIFICYFQLCHKIYINKKQFTEESLTILLLSMLNFLLFLQDMVFSKYQENEIQSISDQFITCIFYVLSGVLVLSIFRTLINILVKIAKIIQNLCYSFNLNKMNTKMMQESKKGRQKQKNKICYIKAEQIQKDSIFQETQVKRQIIFDNILRQTKAKQ